MTGLVLLVGVSVNAVLSNRSSDVDVEPVLGGVPPASGRDDATVDRARLLADLDAVTTALEGTEAGLTLRVDDTDVAVPRPERVTVERSRGVFSATDSVELRLTWWPETDG